MGPMKERFTPEEWTEIEKLPIIVFAMVASADNKVTQEEIEKLIAELGDAVHYRDPLHRELFVDLFAGDHAKLLQSTMEELNDDKVPLVDTAQKRKDILRRHLTEDEYHRFFFSLLGFGKIIADVSGGTMDDTESERLALFATLFDVNIKAGQTAMEEQAGTASSTASTPPPPPDAVPAGWYGDPTGRHQYRWWDGSAWTGNVADEGRQSSDPLMPAAS